MKKMLIGYDDNLGLPNDFVAKVQCDVASYHDLGKMITAFEAKQLDAMFIPAGTLPYIKDYQIISQSLFGAESKDVLKTYFVTIKPITLENISNFTLGRVNQYCTTSYWAPSIYLIKYLPKGATLKFQNVDSFQDMLFKTAAGVLDGSTVWDIILQQNPTATDKTHTLFSVDYLPTPIIVAHAGFPADTIEKINQFKTTDNKAFFTGFQIPNNVSLQKFQVMMNLCMTFYKNMS